MGGAVAQWSKALLVREIININQNIPGFAPGRPGQLKQVFRRHNYDATTSTVVAKKLKLQFTIVMAFITPTTAMTYLKKDRCVSSV